MSRSERKWDHIRYALEQGEARETGFGDVKFVHQSLPNIGVLDVCLNHSFGELSLSSPIFINAMTGGGGEKTYRINKELAIAARHAGLAMAVGSQMAALKDERERYTFEIVRKENPTGVIIANLGSEATIDQAKAAIDMIEANAIQIHLNVIQELTMPEGDRDFSGILKKLEGIVNALDIPVIVKEVGFGMSKETIHSLSQVGVSFIDVGGFGGTNFAQIENKRRKEAFSFFNDWGIPTVVSIVEARHVHEELFVIGSGGITSPLDIVKGMALGASAIGMAGSFLRILMEAGLEGLQNHIVNLHNEISIIMTALGARTISDLKKVPLIISGDSYHWLKQRGIDTKKYSQR